MSLIAVTKVFLIFCFHCRPQKFFSLTHTLFAVTWKRWCALTECFLVIEFAVRNSKIVLRVKMFINIQLSLITVTQVFLIFCFIWWPQKFFSLTHTLYCHLEKMMCTYWMFPGYGVYCKKFKNSSEQSCSVSKETTDVTATRGMLWSDKV